MSAEPVPINLVTAEDLIRLHGIGPMYAARIVAYRDEHGAFRTPADLAQVQGISLELADQLAPDIDWRTAEEMAQAPLSRRQFLTGLGTGRVLKWVVGWGASSAAWDLLKDAAVEGMKAYRELQWVEQDLQDVVDELNHPVIRPESAPTPPHAVEPAATATPESVLDAEPLAPLEPVVPTGTPTMQRFSLSEPQLVLVPAGPFWMGSDRRRDQFAWRGEEPQFVCHLVQRPYYIGRFLVTVAEYQAFIDAGGYHTRAFWTDDGWDWRTRNSITALYNYPDPVFQSNNHPRVRVSWYETVAYCRWLAHVTGRPYRLPTEAEWEKAARGTDGRLYPWGNGYPITTLCNFNNIGGHTTPVGHYSPQGDSPYGCADMAGNVWEWCSTKWTHDYHPYQPDGSLEGDASRVVRGGSFFDDPAGVRCAVRLYYNPFDRFGLLGFRVVLSPSTSDL